MLLLCCSCVVTCVVPMLLTWYACAWLLCTSCVVLELFLCYPDVDPLCCADVYLVLFLCCSVDVIVLLMRCSYVVPMLPLCCSDVVPKLFLRVSDIVPMLCVCCY